MFAPPDSYNAPTRSHETLPDGTPTWILGSLPLGSRVKLCSLVTGMWVASGYLMLSNVSRCSVYLTSEGDGNFIGAAEDLTLARIYGLSASANPHTFQRESPVVWKGVDEDVRAAVMEEDIERDEAARGNRLLEYYIHEEAVDGDR